MTTQSQGHNRTKYDKDRPQAPKEMMKLQVKNQQVRKVRRPREQKHHQKIPMKNLKEDFKNGEMLLKQIGKVQNYGNHSKSLKKVTDKQTKHSGEEYNGKSGLKPIRML